MNTNKINSILWFDDQLNNYYKPVSTELKKILLNLHDFGVVEFGGDLVVEFEDQGCTAADDLTRFLDLMFKSNDLPAGFIIDMRIECTTFAKCETLQKYSQVDEGLFGLNYAAILLANCLKDHGMPSKWGSYFSDVPILFVSQVAKPTSDALLNYGVIERELTEIQDCINQHNPAGWTKYVFLDRARLSNQFINLVQLWVDTYIKKLP